MAMAANAAATRDARAFVVCTEQGQGRLGRDAGAAGADVDAVDEVHGKSSLMYASRRGDVLMVKALIAAGASTELQDNQGLVALDHNEKYLEFLHMKMSHEQQVSWAADFTPA